MAVRDRAQIPASGMGALFRGGLRYALHMSEGARHKPPQLWLAVYALAVVSVPVLATAMNPRAPQAVVAPNIGEEPQALYEADAEALRGLWRMHAAGSDGDPVRFYYFHGDGKGLYRYGREGLTQTQSFDYAVQGDVLVLHLRKTGAKHRIAYRIERAQGRLRLTLLRDPSSGVAESYYLDADGGPRQAREALADLGPAPAGHMWIDYRRFASGGAAFALYQLRPAGIDGRGVGWFHRGDFDDWSTEGFTYRVVGSEIEFRFTLANTVERTGFALSGDKPRRLTLAVDPRDYWHRHVYNDAGVSFGDVRTLARTVSAFATL